MKDFIIYSYLKVLKKNPFRERDTDFFKLLQNRIDKKYPDSELVFTLADLRMEVIELKDVDKEEYKAVFMFCFWGLLNYHLHLWKWIPFYCKLRNAIYKRIYQILKHIIYPLINTIVNILKSMYER